MNIIVPTDAPEKIPASRYSIWCTIIGSQNLTPKLGVWLQRT